MMNALRLLYWAFHIEVRCQGAAFYDDERGQYPAHLEEVFPFPIVGAPSPAA